MIGKQLGNWVIDRELGRGGMGHVYLAHHFREGQSAAVKVLAAELAQEAGFLYRFQREIAALSHLDHPHIVKFYEAGVQDNTYFYAMEYVEGQTFEDILVEHGKWPWKEVLDAALQVSTALKHAHDSGVIHRDLKPSNLMRTADGQVKLTDFGIAKVFASGQLTKTGGIVGTAEFLSPEQAAGKPVTKKSDLYSFGVVLYNLLTGRTPFEGASFVDLLHKHRFGQFDRPKTLVPDIPYELDEVICKLMEKDPADRPPDGLVLHKQLESIRRKLERKSQATDPGSHRELTVSDNQGDMGEEPKGPGPATLMSHLMREELGRQNQGGPIQQFFNKPWVLVTLFVLCVGTIVWAFSRPDDEPGKDPDHNSRPAEEFSEPQRLYELGERLRKQGDFVEAHRVWSNLVVFFEDDRQAETWVYKAREARDQLDDQMKDPKRWEQVRAALKEARGNEAKMKAFRAIYQDNPWLPANLKKELQGK